MKQSLILPALVAAVVAATSSNNTNSTEGSEGLISNGKGTTRYPVKHMNTKLM